MMTDLERTNIFLELDEKVTELVEMLEDNDVNNLNDENLLIIKGHLDILYELIEEERI